MMSQRDGTRVPVVSPFADPSSSPELAPNSASRQPIRSSPLNPRQSTSDNGRSKRRSLNGGSTSTQPPSRNSDLVPLSSSGSGSSESGELDGIQTGHIGAGYGPYPVSATHESSGHAVPGN